MLSVCRLIVPAAVILAAFASPAWAQFAWSTASPESQGMSTSELDALRNALQLRDTTHLLVIRNDRIVYEWYAPGQSRTSLHYTASMAKSVVGGVSLGVALHDGRIALDDFATKYVASWVGVPLKSQIRIRHLGSHTSGLEDAEVDGLSHDQLTGWKGDFWKRLEVPNDPFTIARDDTPALFTAGTSESYSNPGSAMLTYCVTASLQTAPVKDIRTLLRDRIMRPIGVPDGEWSVGYEQTFTVDGLPLVPSWGGSNYSPNAVARVARLMLTNGTWETTELLSASSVQAITTNEGTPGNFAQGWRTNSDHTGGTLPADAFWGEGSGHQIVVVVPSLNLIAVRFGENLDPAADWDAALRTYLFDPLMRAINNAAPGLPTVTTAAATGVTTSGAMLNGSVNPNGLTTTAWFEWGTSPTLATFTATASQAVGSGTTAQRSR
jgi:CubicO group peptidase (beta-lactamase class C family)